MCFRPALLLEYRVALAVMSSTAQCGGLGFESRRGFFRPVFAIGNSPALKWGRASGGGRS
eukprot:3341623-Prymnesium_polylepis.1